MPISPRKQRSNKDLCVITDRLFYKWWMLVFIEESLDKSESQNHQNAYIESGAIHARSMVDFLFGEKSGHHVKRQDSVASDFFTTGKAWEPDLPVCLDYLHFGVFADKQIAHLGYVDGEEWADHPVTKGHFGWDFTEIMNAVQPVLEDFISGVTLEQLGARWYSMEKFSGKHWDGLKAIIKDKRNN